MLCCMYLVTNRGTTLSNHDIDSIRWLSNQRSYKTYSGFKKRLNKVIYNMLNGHR